MEVKENYNEEGNGVGNSIISSLVTGVSNTKDIAPFEPKKVKNNFDPDLINYYIKKYNIEEVNLSNLQKLHEKELINVPFFQKLRKKFDRQIIKSHLMEALGISKSYTGFHEYMRGDREDLPTVGICNIAKTVGYDVMILPVPEDLSKEELDRFNAYRNSFIVAVEQNIKQKNIPTSKTKSKKEKPKLVNDNFLSNLSKSDEELLAGVKESLNEISQEDKINNFTDEEFNDGGGELEMVTKPFQYPTGKLSDEFLNEDTDVNIGNLNNLNELNLGFENFTGYGEFGSIQSGNNFMGGYIDTLGEFSQLPEDDHLMLGADLDEANSKELNKSFINIPK